MIGSTGQDNTVISGEGGRQNFIIYLSIVHAKIQQDRDNDTNVLNLKLKHNF